MLFWDATLGFGVLLMLQIWSCWTEPTWKKKNPNFYFARTALYTVSDVTMETQMTTEECNILPHA